ncbi:site-specific integrase [uncultured Parabacteroides sp.]|uniref:tyrosine-type recombinase/integrase n=1 Tax=uncultured Parabacteroides sp. TaxID=512312 RepID=UPI00261A738E|nr:site-specific integrase [uncultured Parabacteroides sp.]
MATIKVKFRPSSVELKEGTLFYQIIHLRLVRQINTGYKLFPSEWDRPSHEIILPEEGAPRYDYLISLKKRIELDVERLQGIISNFESLGESYTSDKVVEAYSLPINKDGFLAFSKETIIQLKQIGRSRTAETYTTALNSFIRFRGGNGDIPIHKLDSSLMVEYETYLKSEGICLNTVSFYMRNLRAIYNRAVEKELTLQRNPFKHVYTGIDKTVKRAVTSNVIRQIRDLDLKSSPTLDYARDIFMFSFYTRGMSFIDMAFLKKKDLKNGVLSYRRQKTNQQLLIKWESPMQEIVDKYDTGGTPYLLPIIKNCDDDVRRQYKNASHLVNKKLKLIGKQLGLQIALTTYVARHAWASIAKSKNVSLSVISEAMGHDSENTTRIYLTSLDSSVVDKANMLVIKSL